MRFPGLLPSRLPSPPSHCVSSDRQCPIVWVQPQGHSAPSTDFSSLAALQGQQHLFAFSVHPTPTRCSLGSFRERLKLKQDPNSAIYVLFRFYWRVSMHTVKIKSPAEPISRDQWVPILKAKLTRLCQVKIRAKTFHTSALSTAAKNSKATERKMLPAVHKEPLQHNINLCTLI